MRLAGLLDEVVAALAASGLQLVKRFHDPRGPDGGPSERAIFSLPGAPNRRAVFVDLTPEGWVLRRQFGSWLVCIKSAPLGQADDQIAARVMDAIRDAALDDLNIRQPAPAVAEWLEAAAAASIAVPFIQAMASKAGTDTYQRLRTLLRRSSPHEHAGEDPAAPTPPTAAASPSRVYRRVVTDPATNTLLIVPEPTPDEALAQLASIDPSTIKGRVLMWDAMTETWTVVK